MSPIHEYSDAPLVSVVIPTRNRANLVPRAVKSVLSQTYSNLEVVVVIDGPDPDTEVSLSTISDSRLTVVPLEQSVGGSDARNAGVQVARGEWIAFLDDDDEWLPAKLEKQMEIALSVPSRNPIISCRVVATSNHGECIWPTRLPKPLEPISEYLLARKGVARNDGLIATDTILTTRTLLCLVRFRSGLKRHQDWDWVLRAVSEHGADVYFCDEVLAVYHTEDPESVSRRADWKYSLDWIKEMRTMVTSNAYASFITSHVAWQARTQKDWKACLPLLTEAIRGGSPTTSDVIRYVGFWCMPQRLRHTVAGWLA